MRYLPGIPSDPMIELYTHPASCTLKRKLGYFIAGMLFGSYLTQGGCTTMTKATRIVQSGIERAADELYRRLEHE